MPARLLHHLIPLCQVASLNLRQRLLVVTRPAVVPLAVGVLTNLTRSKSALVAENDPLCGAS